MGVGVAVRLVGGSGYENVVADVAGLDGLSPLGFIAKTL